MTPGVPSHGPGCWTRTYPTRCWVCDERVFYFECSHGSKLRFDELGEPWPIHRDDSLPYQRKLEIVEAKTGSKDAAARYLETQMMTGTIDAAYGRRIQAAWWRDAGRQADEPQSDVPPREIVRMDPYAGATEKVRGVVRELNGDVDVYRRLGLPETAVSAAALAELGELGELGEGRFAQFTVHSSALGEPDTESYTFFIRTRRLATLGVRRGHLVRCSLRGVPVIERDPVWLCDRIEWPI